MSRPLHKLLSPLRILGLLVGFLLLGELLLRVQRYGATGLTYADMNTTTRLLHSEFALEPSSESPRLRGSDGLLPNRKGLSKSAPFEVNNFGFRGLDLELRKEPGSLRVVVLGGSTTLAQGVRLEETWPAVVERRLNERPQQGTRPRYQFLNLAVPNTHACLDRHLQRALYFRPDLVIWQISRRGTDRECRSNLKQTAAWAQKRSIPVLALYLNEGRPTGKAPTNPWFRVLPPLHVDHGPEHYVYPGDSHPDASVHATYGERIAELWVDGEEDLLALRARSTPVYRTQWKPPAPTPMAERQQGFWECYVWRRVSLAWQDLRLHLAQVRREQPLP